MNQEYKKESAGREIISAVPVVSEKKTVEETRNDFYKNVKDFETINYFYAVDEEFNLKGVISIKKILNKEINGEISDFMEKDLVKVNPSTDREKVALLALKHNFKSIPVTDKNNKFLGVVSSDTILNILYKESAEDLLLAGGLLADTSVLEKASPGKLVIIRLPWLLIGLFGGIIAARIINAFESTLQAFIALAFFIPVVVYLSGAVSTQSATIFIRKISFNGKFSIVPYFLKELKVGAILGLLLGAMLSFFSFLFWENVRISLVLFLSTFLGIIFSVFSSIAIPVILFKMKKDPAVGTSPLATIISDVLSISVYLLIASILL